MAEEEENKGGSKKLIIIVVALVILLGGGGAAFFVMKSGKGSEAKADEPKEVLSEMIYEEIKPGYIVSFKIEGDLHYLKIGVQIGTKSKKTLAYFKKHEPLARDRAIMYLSGLEEDTIMTPEGRMVIKSKLLTIFNDLLDKDNIEHKLDDVLIKDFVVQ